MNSTLGRVKAMFWLQAFACLAVWIVEGVVLMRHSGQLRTWLDSQSRVVLGAGGGFLIVLSLAALVVALARLASSGAMKEGPMSLAIWLAVASIGLAFVFCQTLSTAMLVSLATRRVTQTPLQTSVSEDSQKG